MRLCYAGPVWTKAPKTAFTVERGQDGAHSCNGIGTALTATAARYGIEIEQWNFWGERTPGVSTADAYDGVIIYDHSMLPLWERVVPNWDWLNRTNVFWGHAVHLENDATVRHFCEQAKEKADLIGFLDDAVREDFRRIYGNRAGLFVWPWGCRQRTFTTSQLNPYRTDKKVALWCGRIGRRAVDYLQRVFSDLPDFELHVISITPEQDDYVRGNLPGVYEGCLKYGTFDGYLSYADVGLDLAIHPGQTAVNTKAYEYLGAGLPVAYEDVLGSHVIRELEHGVRSPFDDVEGYRSAIREAAEIPVWRRRLAAARSQRLHSWESRAELLLTELLRIEPTIGRDTKSPVGAWSSRYAAAGIGSYGGSKTYEACADFFVGCKTVEDWGSGLSGFKALTEGKYDYTVKNIDGSWSSSVDVVADLETYTSAPDGILLRHVIEHNHGWREILKNALQCARQRVAVVIYTPIESQTRVLCTPLMDGVPVPTYSFSMADLQEVWGDWTPEVQTIEDPRTDFGRETLLLFTRK